MDKNNVPYVTKNVSTVISANVISKFDLGTHTLFIAQVIDINDINNSKPITYDEYQKNVVLKEKNKSIISTYYRMEMSKMWLCTYW